MFGSVWNFVKRHKRKFIYTGVVVGGVWALGKYAKNRLVDFQEKEAAECLAHAKRQHHFDSNQRTCNMTVLSMLPSLREALQTALDSEALTAQLKDRPTNRLQVWEDLKIISFSRTLCAVYSVCILISVLRVQLNIIGGYMYLDSVNTASDENAEKQVANPSVQQQYLANIQYVVDQGLKDLIGAVTSQVKTVMSDISLKQQISLPDIQTIIHDVRKGMEYRRENGYHDAGASSLVHYMIPEDERPTVASSLTKEELFFGKLDRETRDMLESGDFHSVLTSLIDSAFSRLTDRVAEYYKPIQQTNGTLPSLNDLSMPMAKVIPIVNGLLHTVLAEAPNAYVQELLLKEQVKDFAANVYEAFSQPETASGQTMA